MERTGENGGNKGKVSPRGNGVKLSVEGIWGELSDKDCLILYLFPSLFREWKVC